MITMSMDIREPGRFKVGETISLFFRKNAKKAHELWWLGLPPSVRGRVWKLAFGNDLHITQGRQLQASVFYIYIVINNAWRTLQLNQ
jgi:hypothetical protein